MAILKGKLIKKNDEKNMNMLDIQSFSWLSFKEKNIVFPDNSRRSVILQKYHDPQEMREKVKDASLFKQPLENKSTPLYPVDLTEDYDRGIKELVKRKRRRLMGEEEAMALELAEIDPSQAVQFKAKPSFGFHEKSSKKETKEEGKEQTMPAEAAADIPENKRESILKIQDPVEQVKSLEVQHESIIKENKTEHALKIENPIIGKEDLTLMTEHTNSIPQENIEEKNLDNKREEIEKQGYHAGYENGYLEGFKNGEEIAARAQESKYEIVFNNVANVVDQIEKIKNSLYAQSKDVFIEIVKLCSEKILRQQIKFSDNSLFSLFDDVIKAISEKSTMKIELNSQDLIRMQKHVEKIGIQDRVTLSEDPAKQIGDFTVESERGISIVSLEKTVENLVDKLKAELFSDEENIEQTKSAG